MINQTTKELLKKQLELHREFTTPARVEALKLWWNAYHSDIHRNMARRWELAGRIEQFSHNGQVAINTGGRDCDMAQWDGDIRIITAHWWELEKLTRSLEDSAEGPFWAYPIPWEDQAECAYHSRDLALEAFEDGHPHVVYQ